MGRLAAAKAWASKNRVLLGGGAAVAVAAIAYTRSKGAGSGGSGGSAAKAATVTGAPQASLANASGAYSSTDSDVYNAIQPQIESLRDLMESLQGNTASPIPVPGLPTGSSTTTTTSAADDQAAVSRFWGLAPGVQLTNVSTSAGEGGQFEAAVGAPAGIKITGYRTQSPYGYSSTSFAD